MKKGLMIIGAILLALILAGGSFYGGMAYQRAQVQSRFTNRGQNGGAGRGFGGDITGQVTSFDGNSLTLSTGQNSITLSLSASAKILKTSPDTPSDLATGEQVVVSGQRDANGNFTANEIIILQQPAAQ